MRSSSLCPRRLIGPGRWTWLEKLPQEEQDLELRLPRGSTFPPGNMPAHRTRNLSRYPPLAGDGNEDDGPPPPPPPGEGQEASGNTQIGSQLKFPLH
uniref:Uncharacterized protein n=1 Tax=Knipowitschia caucasica TaxID=637954 RepID=A0AAV2L6K1_KNICA